MEPVEKMKGSAFQMVFPFLVGISRFKKIPAVLLNSEILVGAING